jgi:cysteine synthase A
VRIVLADPEGSALASWVTTGEQKASGNSITEGIGQAARAPGNLAQARDAIDDAITVTDTEALEQVFDLQAQEGISVGGSAGLNVAAAIRVARDLGPGHRVVTILCDGAARYQSKLFNPDFLRSKGLPVPPWMA